MIIIILITIIHGVIIITININAPSYKPRNTQLRQKEDLAHPKMEENKFKELKAKNIIKMQNCNLNQNVMEKKILEKNIMKMEN